MTKEMDEGFTGLNAENIDELLGKDRPTRRVFGVSSKPEPTVVEEPMDERFSEVAIHGDVEEPVVVAESVDAYAGNADLFMKQPPKEQVEVITEEIVEEIVIEEEPVVGGFTAPETITEPIHRKTTIPVSTQDPDPELVEYTETGDLDITATILPSKTASRQQVLNRGTRLSLYTDEKIIRVQKKLVKMKTDPELLKDPELIEYFQLEEYMAALDTNRDNTGIEETFFQNPKRKIGQGVTSSKDGKLLSMRPVSVDTEGEESDSNTAKLAAAEFFKVGESILAPLPHSGFWAVMAPVPDAAIAVLYSSLANEQGRLGRTSLGLTYTNISVKLNEIVFRFLLPYIEATSIEDLSVQEAMELFSSNDLNHLFWACARGRYNLGYLYRRLCSANETCKHIEEQNLDLESMVYYDDNAFTKEMREVFSNTSPESVSVEDVKKYQAEYHKTLEEFSTFEFMGAKFKFKVPTAYEHFSDGNLWIEDMEGLVAEAMAKEDLSKLREESLLDDFLKTSYVRIWSHYVESAELNSFKPKGREAINSVLTEASSKRKFFEKFVEAVTNFRNQSIISAVGIDEYTCVKCGDINISVDEASRVDEMIPLDMLHVFFMMFHTRYQMAMGQES